ncbi:UpxY family transcription antiterminator [Spirosoma sp. SC4-14]|uniref:UpxY family transcription antiterminator n=1 Tax=Spirosoma sp. SC4-14 TaxID=3128900 RepID=UPI0030D0265C
MPWFVLYTKSRNEKQVAAKLKERGIEVYCPLTKTKRRWSDRTKWVEEPLFRSYCFVNLDEHERARVFGIPGIVRYLFWLNKPAVVRNDEIGAIKRLLNEFDHSQIRVESFSPNDRVTIGSGSFSDTTGSVIGQQGNQLAILLDALQVVVRVDLIQTLVLS